MQEVEVTFGRAAQVWWAWTWRALFSAIILGFLIGLVVAFIGRFAGINPQTLMIVNFVLGGVMGIAASIWAQLKILKKKFGTFRIALIQD